MPNESEAGVAPMMLALSDYIAGALENELPEAVVQKARHHILDTVAAIVVGATLKPGRVGLAFVASQGGNPVCAVGTTGHRTSPVNAAFAIGMQAAAGETDDSHFLARMHPGCAIVPPLLALGADLDRSGCDFLRAVVLGYDIGCRTTLSLDEALLDGAMHSPHAIGGLFGATAACAALQGLAPWEVRHALSFAVQQASGLTSWMSDSEHIEKAFVFGGCPARNAVTAVTMVACGFTGNPDAFHSPNNFFDCFSPRPARAEMLRGLGREFEINRAMIKKWTVGSPIQAALDSAQALRRKHDLRPAEIERVVVTMPDKELKIVDNRAMPEICMQHLVALMLVDGDVTLESSHDHARMADPLVAAIRARLHLLGSAEMTRTPPPRQARVEITMADGRLLSHHTAAVRGTPDNPMTSAEVEEKALGLMASRVGEAKARSIIALIRDIERTTVRAICEELALP